MVFSGSSTAWFKITISIYTYPYFVFMKKKRFKVIYFGLKTKKDHNASKYKENEGLGMSTPARYYEFKQSWHGTNTGHIYICVLLVRVFKREILNWYHVFCTHHAKKQQKTVQYFRSCLQLFSKSVFYFLFFYIIKNKKVFENYLIDYFKNYFQKITFKKYNLKNKK